MFFKSEESTSDSQCSDIVERQQSGNPQNNPRSHVRACESCRGRKVRCLPEDANKCQRCARSGRECIYTAPEKRRRRKRTDARVAELEQMVQMLAAKLEDEQRARLEQGQDAQKSPQDHGNILERRPIEATGILSQSPTRKESLRQTAQHASKTPVLTSSQRRATTSLASTNQNLPLITAKSTDPFSPIDQHPSPDARLQTFMPSPSLDYTKPSSVPARLQVGPWPTPSPYLSPPLQQADWHEAICSPYASPSQSASLASTASPQTEIWPSPAMSSDTPALEHDLSMYHPMFIEDKSSLAFQDPSTWWPESDFADADQQGYFQNIQAHGYSTCAQSQQWDFPCTEV